MYQLTSIDADMKRDDQGRFIEQSSSLHPKTIGLRLHKSHYQRFYDKAQEMDLAPTELARQVIEDWLDNQPSSTKNKTP